jgi:6-phosphofructokinase
MVKRIGILTGGGDCPGLNPAIKWVVKTALDEELAQERGYEFEMVGLRDGWRGLVQYDPRFPILPPGTDFKDRHYARFLTEGEVRTWDRLGGTRLGTSRTNPYNPKRPTWQQVIDNVGKLGLDGLVAIGGDDTLSITAKLAEEGVNIVCIPKTIDRDLQGTDYSLGFETAVGVIVEEIDRIRTTAHSHSRTFIVETMGRYTGHLALSGGLAAGADIILIPEVPFSTDRVIEIVKAKRDAGQRYAIVVVAEGATESGGNRSERAASKEDQFGHPTLGGIAQAIERRVEQGTGGEVRSVVLSHLQRGGVPCSLDRRMAREFGIAAMQLVEEGKFGRMVVFSDGKFDSIKIPKNLKDVRKVDVASRYDAHLYNARFSLTTQ